MTAEGAFGRVAAWIAPADEVDWDAVYAERLPAVYNYFRYRVGDGVVAEDLTSITFVKAWRSRRGYRRDLAGFGTWLMAIARNVATDHFRSERRHAPLEAAADVTTGVTPEDVAERRSDIERLVQLLAALPDRDRELIALKYGGGLTNRAIASMTGLSESNVGTLLHRTVQTMRAQW